MCGVNIIVDKKSQLGETNIAAMNKALSHRGPDHSQHKQLTYGGATIYLGHTRLKIIDLSNYSNQPYSDADENQWLVFNGAIYNAEEFMNITPKSDTEGLFSGLKKSTFTTLQKCNGMYALGFCDLARGKLTLARDPQGIKPLYTFENADYLVASSEISGILASGIVQAEINKEAIDDVLCYKHIHGRHTAYKGIVQLSPGSHVEIDLQSMLKSVDQFDYEQGSQDDLESIFLSSVERHLLSDVDVGLFLSGGVDSTLILAALQKLGKSNTPCFTSSDEWNSSHGTSDYQYAQKACDLYGGSYHPISSRGITKEEIDDHIINMDQPSADSASLLTSKLSEEVSKNAKVVLTGAGADEWFGGYGRHVLTARHNKNLARAVSLSRPFTSHIKVGHGPGRSGRRNLHKLNRTVLSNPHVSAGRMTTLDREAMGLTNPTLKLNTQLPALDALLEYDRAEYLSNDILLMTDEMSMRHGLETRTPFLDNEMRSWVGNQSSKALVSTIGKKPLKDLLIKWGGAEFVNRPKSGFGFPLGHYISELFNEFTSRNDRPIYEWVSRPTIERLLDLHERNKRDFSQELWCIYVLDLWITNHG